MEQHVCGLLLALFLTSVLAMGVSFSANGDLELHDVDPVQVVWDQPALIMNKAAALGEEENMLFSPKIAENN